MFKNSCSTLGENCCPRAVFLKLLCCDPYMEPFYIRTHKYTDIWNKSFIKLCLLRKCYNLSALQPPLAKPPSSLSNFSSSLLLVLPVPPTQLSSPFCCLSDDLKIWFSPEWVAQLDAVLFHAPKVIGLIPGQDACRSNWHVSISLLSKINNLKF